MPGLQANASDIQGIHTWLLRRGASAAEYSASEDLAWLEMVSYIFVWMNIYVIIHIYINFWRGAI